MTANLRVTLWVLLGMAAVLNYVAWMRDYPPRLATPDATRSAPAVPLGSSAPTVAPSASGTPSTAGAVAATGPVAAAVSGLGGAVGSAAAAASVQVRTDVLAAEVSLEGGALTQADLLAYPEAKNTPNKPVRLLTSDPAGLFVVQGGLAGTPGEAAPTHLALYSSAARSLTLAPQQDTLVLPLIWSDGHGVTVTKTFTFHRGRYEVDVSYSVENASGTPWSFAPYVQLLRVNQPVAHSYFNPSTYAFKGPAIDDGTRFQKFDITKNPMLDEPVRGGYLAALQHDFVVAVLPQPSATYQYQLLVQGIEYELKGTGATQQVLPGGRGAASEVLFIGPKLHAALAALDPRLPLVTDYGYLRLIAEPLYQVLNYAHQLVGNWGFAIIIVTALLKLLFYPLAEASGKSMAKMKSLAPRLTQLRETFKDDKEKLNRAMMEMYQREKINPLAGCLPMLIQVPVFLAFYWVLRDSVEIRQAPFVFWITDLSSKDPLFVLPAIMAAAMFAQFRLTPQTGDPTQQKVMMFMPLIMSGTFAFFPAGLVLYWVTNTLLSILQQWNINRRLEASTKK
jgi:YidC/Oxa1 family membrane protein insertase